MIFPVILSLVLINTAVITAELGGDKCTTPEGKSGTCISTQRCHVLVHVLRQPGHPTSEDLDRLRKSICGSENGGSKVCCPSWSSSDTSLESSSVASIVTPAAPTTPSPGVPDRPPDVTNHPNLNLLDHHICGRTSQDKIIGGNKTGLFDYPWMALIAYKIHNQHVEFRCGGTVINNRYILTAAHCVTQLIPAMTLFGVRVGEHNLLTEKDCNKNEENPGTVCAARYQDFGIEEVHFHSGFTKSLLHDDIGLIRVDLPIDFHPINARPICLPIGDSGMNYRRRLIVTGWGATETRSISPELLQAKLTLVSNAHCAKAYKKNTVIWHKQLCAQGNGHQFSCLGDSGGPLQAPSIYNKTNMRFVQYGIVSFGTGDCKTPGYPSVYTRLVYYTHWILDHLKE